MWSTSRYSTSPSKKTDKRDEAVRSLGEDGLADVCRHCAVKDHLVGVVVRSPIRDVMRSLEGMVGGLGEVGQIYLVTVAGILIGIFWGRGGCVRNSIDVFARIRVRTGFSWAIF